MEPFTFQCPCCGETVTEIPDIAFDAPIYYHWREEGDRARLDSDFCVINDEEFFIRAVCPLPIIGTDRFFAWGIWVSLSAENFARYEASCGDTDQSKLGGMFGWFSNRLPDYPETLNLQTDVMPRDGNQRPHVFIQTAHAEHPLYIEQQHGITQDRLGQIHARHACANSGNS